MFKPLLNALMEGASTTVTGKLFHELITLFEKLFACSFNLDLFLYNLKAWPLVLRFMRVLRSDVHNLRLYAVIYIFYFLRNASSILSDSLVSLPFLI